MRQPSTEIWASSRIEGGWTLTENQAMRRRLDRTTSQSTGELLASGTTAHRINVVSIHQDFRTLERRRESYWTHHPASGQLKLRWRALMFRHIYNVVPGES